MMLNGCFIFCRSEIGQGFQISNIRNKMNAAAKTGTVLGSYNTDSIMPHTSSSTNADGSLEPKLC